MLNYKKKKCSQVPVLTPVILATQEAVIRRMVVRSQPGQIVRDPILKNPSQNGAGVSDRVPA
jgi:hypothetical protein